MSDAEGKEPIYEACEGCEALMDVTAFNPYDKVVCPTCSVETHVKRTFGSYRLERLHAIGGMSVIYHGWDTTLGRKVAIKVLNEQYCHDERRIQAFENEARLTAQVSHPNVIQVYAVGRAYGRFYLVMELLKGKNFESIIKKRGALPEKEVLDIALQVISGLRAAKKAGMIHRDVKPGNIIIDDQGHAHLLDFGLALITKNGRARAEEVWATPYYVPPEALEQGIEDFRSDLYAFGACLYHALAGRPPFESKWTSNTILRRAKQTIPRLGKVAPWVSEATCDIVDRLMAFYPEDRWSSYAEVLKALERAKKSSGQKRHNPVHGQNRLKRRKRKSYFGLTYALLLISLCITLALWQPWKKDDPPATPAIPLVELPDEEEIAFNPGGTPQAELFDSWRMARAMVREGDYPEASEAFLKLADQPTLSGMPQVWATFEAAVASSLAGQPGRARKLVSKSLEDLDNIPRQRSLQRRFRRIAEVLSGAPPPGEDDFPEKTNGITEWMGEFALALKLWDQGFWKQSLPVFSRVRGAVLPEPLDWFRIYQEIADIYLGDGIILAQLEQLPGPTSAEDAQILINRIAETAGSLKTNGRAPYNLQARQDHLHRRRLGFLATSSEKFSGDPWVEFRLQILEKARTLRFDDLSSLLQKPPADAPEEAIWAWRHLLTGTRGFLNDLSTMENRTIRTRDGREINPVAGTSEGIELADGDLVPWKDLLPDALLGGHTGNKAHAAAFAWMTGLFAEAGEIAGELAKEDEIFRREWDRMLAGIKL